MDKPGSISLSSLNRSDNTDKLQCPDCQKVYKKPIFQINYHETDILNLKQQIDKLKCENKRLQLELDNKYAFFMLFRALFEDFLGYFKKSKY